MIDKSIIESYFGIPVDEPKQGRNNSKEYQYNCPFCLENRGDPDYKGHLFVNDKTGCWHCYRCGASGKLKDSGIGEYSNSKLIDNTELLKSLIKIVSEDTSDSLDMVIPRKKALDDIAARGYLNGRGFSDEIIDLYDIRVGNIFSNLLGYVIIPNQVRGRVMTDMYCARNFVGQEPRYRNPTDSKSGVCVFNLHRIPQNPKRIIICEGAFNAIAAGVDATSLYGKECGEAKLSKILAKRPQQVIINLDLDAAHLAYKLARKIKRRDDSIDVRICLIDKPGFKDSADFLKAGRIKEYHELIERSIIFNPLLDGLLGVLNNEEN